jgi:DNA invertase Pin-like site-specific DNA recombinase
VNTPPGHELAAEPAILTGALIGYARVSTIDQHLDRQIHALEEAGCLRVFTDKQSGRTADRAGLTDCLDYLRPGDTLVVPSLDRLSRSLADLITLIAELRRRGVGFRSLHEALDTTTPGGRLVFHVFAALAEFIRELIVEGTREGLVAARARGVRLGRPPAMTPEQISHARDLLTRPDNTVASIARLLGVSRSTLYKYLPELAGGRGQLPAGTTAELPVDTRPPPDVSRYDDLLPSRQRPATSAT